MSAETGTPSSAPLGRDPGRVAARHDDVNPGEIAVGVIIGRTSEFFDFFVYAIASVLVFPKYIFPYVDPLSGTLIAFAIFALAFVSRPFGSIIFMAVDRAHGRGVKLTVALFLLAARLWLSRSCRAIAISAIRRECCWRCSGSARAWPGAACGMGSPRCSPLTLRRSGAAGTP
ncbi:MAG: hypothetical protein WDN69_01505 [Aliidongia sp.]